MTQHPTPNELEQQRIIDHARSSIDRCRRDLAETGLTPEACLEALRRSEGDAAVEGVRREVEEMLRGVREQIRRDATHAIATRPVTRYAARRKLV
jgi:hypothetical protein